MDLRIPLFMAGATATAGVGALAVNGLPFSGEKESISSLLSKDPTKRAIADGEDWTKAWAEYKKSAKDIWSLGSGDDVPPTLKSECKSRLEFKVSGTNSEEYKHFLSYCTRDTLISDLLKDAQETPLSSSEGPETDGWKKAWDSYIKANKEKSGDVWSVTDFQSKKNTSNENAPEDFRKKCETHLGSKDISNTDLFNQVKSWCTKPKG
ncbi:hypothetical protein HF1_11440 [Mycoplasma haemofelis str. Langford 1]|uniref:Uncharacterized protein n=1 Tax=Mycoplasma haemofelis (strain Langford 1) TaxID=941640 RepID=E8ZJ31_MYCHL|nr:hypothetical protein [Mycoplasma haemofelis]CBY93152.1 hypothetical protein HF1_11440 [Mycoplasma haemofelis str. Langford 1]